MKHPIHIFTVMIALMLPMLANAQTDWDFDYSTPQEYIDSFNVNINRAVNQKTMLTYEAPPQDVPCWQGLDSLGRRFYMYNRIYVEDFDAFNKASMIIDAGIEKFPRRLDMRMGAAQAAMIDPIPDRVEIALCEALEYGHENGHNWLWADDEPLEDAENALLDAVCDYVYQMYGREEFQYAIRNVTMTVLEHKPQFVPSLNVMAALELERDTGNALELFMEINSIDPDDVLVMSNIAWCHCLREEYGEAADWYRKILRKEGLDADFRADISNSLKECEAQLK